MYRYPDLKGEKPPPSWVSVLRYCETFSLNPATAMDEPGAARWYLRWVIDSNARIEANKKADG